MSLLETLEIREGFGKSLIVVVVLALMSWTDPDGKMCWEVLQCNARRSDKLNILLFCFVFLLQFPRPGVTTLTTTIIQILASPSRTMALLLTSEYRSICSKWCRTGLTFGAWTWCPKAVDCWSCWRWRGNTEKTRRSNLFVFVRLQHGHVLGGFFCSRNWEKNVFFFCSSCRQCSLSRAERLLNYAVMEGKRESA